MYSGMFQVEDAAGGGGRRQRGPISSNTSGHAVQCGLPFYLSCRNRVLTLPVLAVLPVTSLEIPGRSVDEDGEEEDRVVVDNGRDKPSASGVSGAERVG